MSIARAPVNPCDRPPPESVIAWPDYGQGDKECELIPRMRFSFAESSSLQASESAHVRLRALTQSAITSAVMAHVLSPLLGWHRVSQKGLDEPAGQ